MELSVNLKNNPIDGERNYTVIISNIKDNDVVPITYDFKKLVVPGRYFYNIDGNSITLRFTSNEKFQTVEDRFWAYLENFPN